VSKYVAEYMIYINAVSGYYKWLKATYPDVINDIGKVEKKVRKRK
jgi:hypothetical protein